MQTTYKKSMDTHIFDNSQTLRASVLEGLSLFLTAVATFFAIFNSYYTQNYYLSGIELVFACHSVYIYQLAKKHLHKLYHIQSYVLFLVVVVTVGTYIQPMGNGLFLWTTLFPVLLYALLGQKQGRWVSGVFLVIQTINVYHKTQHDMAYDAIPTLVNLLLCYVGVWVVAHIYEYNRRNIENSLTFLASRDSLTGAHNRLSLSSTFRNFEKHRDSTTTLCLLFIDLDYFKQINDLYGHDAGDKVLIETTRLLSQTVGDDNLYRIGGEEFCVTLFDQNPDQAENVGERLCTMMSQHLFAFGGKRIQLTLSVGICEYSEGDQLSDLLKLADIELYHAKKNGRNQVRLCRTANASRVNKSEFEPSI